MKKIALAFLFCTLTLTLAAQRPSQGGGGPAILGSIKGVLIDSVNNTPIEFATVVLTNEETGKQVDGGLTEPDGSFKLIEIPTGKYKLDISFLGYQSKEISGIETTPKEPDYDLGNIGIVSEGITLAEVEITGEAGVIENKIDKLVYNADKDATTTAGGSATDVLERVPLLSVDAEGNVSLRGSGNIQILINGKPSVIFNTDPANALRTLSADQIKSVEVITAPSAKYDGEGSAGIINIITKKSNLEGVTGSINASIGNRNNRTNGNISFARGRFGLSANMGGYFSWPVGTSASFYREDYLDSGETRLLEQESTGESVRGFFGGGLSAYYDFNAYNSINTSLNLRPRTRDNENFTESFFEDPSIDLIQNYERFSDSKSRNVGFDWTTDYTKKFKKKDQQFSIAYQFSGDISDQENRLDQFGDDESLNIQELNTNDGDNIEQTFQLDYAHPFTKDFKIETGGKYIIRDIISDFEATRLDPDLNEFVTINNRTDEFKYDQDVIAGYASATWNITDKYGLIAGVRYEHTSIAGDYKIDTTQFSNEYDNWIPSVIFSRKLNQFSNLRFSYSKRIQRPSLRFVNPYVDLSDPRDVTVGNPDLLPENTDQYEISYGTYIKGVVLNLSTFYRQTNDNIESYISVNDDGVSITTFQNIGTVKSFGFNAFSSFKLWKKLEMRGFFNFNTYDSEAEIEGESLSNQGVEFNTRLSGTLSLPGDIKVEASGYYSSPRQSLQGSRASWRSFSAGILKELWDKKATIGLRVFQPFSRDIIFDQESAGPDFYQFVESRTEIRSLQLSFGYRFGNLDGRRARQRRSNINNDDLKGDGGEENFGG